MKVKLHSQILNISLGYNPRRQIYTKQGYKSWPHVMRNVSFPEVNRLKNSATLAVSFPINPFPLSKFNLPLIGTFTWPTPPGPFRATTCRTRELNYGSHTCFLTTQGHGGPPRMSDQPNAGATSKTAQTWKTIHTNHTLSHPSKAKMEWRWRRPNDIRGPWGSKVSWHLSYRWGKTPKKPHPGNLSRPGIEPGPLRDKRACYHLLYSGGQEIYSPNKIAKSLHVFKININLDTAPPLRFFLLS